MSKIFDEFVQKTKEAASAVNGTISTALTAFVHSEAAQRAADVADLGKEKSEKMEKRLHQELAGVEEKKGLLDRRVGYMESFKARAEQFMQKRGSKTPLEFKDTQFSKPMAEELGKKSSALAAQIESRGHTAKVSGGSALMLNAAVGPILLVEGARELERAVATEDKSLGTRGAARAVQGATALGTAIPAVKGLAAGSKILGPLGIAAGAVVSGSEAYDAKQEANRMRKDGFEAAASIKDSEAMWRAGTAVGVPAIGIITFSAATALSAPVWFPVAACVGATAALSLASSYGAHLFSDRAKHTQQEQMTKTHTVGGEPELPDAANHRPITLDGFTSKLTRFRAERDSLGPISPGNEHGKKFAP